MRVPFVRRFVRNQQATAIIEFALVVPIFFTMVWGIISFSRAYQRLNVLTSSLREGARVASTLDWVSPGANAAANTTLTRTSIRNFSTAFGYSIDTAQVTVDASTGLNVRVYVTNYALFSGLNFLGNLSAIPVTREANFRLERATPP
jgi:Flp pilus assembly protein TadG